MPRLRLPHFLISIALVLTVVLLWFATANFRSAAPVAQSILRGLALSLGQAIESVAVRDPSLKLLADFTSRDIAFFSVLDRRGIIRFHSNTDLIGEQVGDQRYRALLGTSVLTEERIRLGTGEEVYETQQQLHLAQGMLVLRLALHTWQADQIIHRARNGLLVILLLLVAAWSLGGFALWLLRRDELRRMKLAQQEQLAQLGALGAVMAHEVRTPLAGIKGYAQLLEECLQDGRLLGYAGKIVAESERLEGLVNDLLTYVRQEPLPAGKAALEQVLNDVWDGLLGDAKQAGVKLLLVGSVAQPVACPADRLRQLFLNLFSNALQAMPEGGQVRVELGVERDMARVLIADTGPGFAQAHLQRIFDPFFTTRASGSGLGLAICRKLAEGYGGSIIAANGCSGGAEIELKLPLVKEQA